jgi:pimeloyl-ACP methyl ester carboxylesterase
MLETGGTYVLLGVLAGLCGVAGLLVIAAWWFARRWCTPRRGPSTRTPADYGLPFEEIEFPSHGVTIRGWFVPAGGGGTMPPVVVLTHGWSTGAVEMLPMARTLHRAGMTVLLYDSRGHGRSGEDGPITIRKFAEDVIASADFLMQRSGIDREKLGVVGRSIGGSAAIVAASMDPRIRAVVSCSAFADPQALTRYELARRRIPAWPFAGLVGLFIERWLGVSMDRIAPMARIGLVGAPILLIHGGQDRLVSPSDLETLHARSCQDRTWQLLLPNRGHTDVLRDRTCGRETVAFLSKALETSHARGAEAWPSSLSLPRPSNQPDRQA